MIKIDLNFVELPFLVPVPVRGRLIQKNRFLKVSVLEETYYLSVLPHFHDITLEEVSFKLQFIFSNYEFNFKEVNLEKRFFNTLPDDQFLSSIKDEMLFQIETIILGMLKKTHLHLFNSTEELKMNDLFSDTNPISSYKDAKCIKIKIDPTSAFKTLELIKNLSQQNSKTIFRLDGNRRFEIWEMIHFYDVLRKGLDSTTFLKIDYLEEPLKNFYDTFLLEKRSEIKIALDESCKNYMQHSESVSNIFVLKPSLIGLSPIFLLLRSRQDLRAIISSSFEHPTVLLGLRELAKLRPKEFHGLENFIK
ncbi:MAG: hypothetical protein K2Q18_04510 [Bdellovibrionales bacterium]|nr:hypothetical protein [Bdellovibrionales bacterium]